MKHIYIMRLDDACPTMNTKRWTEMQNLLEKYNIQPIVGIIPDNKDDSFACDVNENFWELVKSWKSKGWTIAQHGYHHTLEPIGKKKCYFKTIEKESEFVGKSKCIQKLMLQNGYQIMKDNDCIPSCFFSPAHTFDKNTVEAIKELNIYNFISDGHDFRIFNRDGMTFIPSVFDSPHVIFGVQTFIEHPNNITKERLEMWEAFFKKNKSKFCNADELYKSNKLKYDHQSLLGVFVQYVIYGIRRLRSIKK